MCAALWPAPDVLTPLDVVAVMNFKATPVADLVNWVDLYLLHGVELIVLADNNCAGEDANIDLIEPALQPYVARGLVTHDTSYRCRTFPSSNDVVRMRYDALRNSRLAASRLRPSTLVVAFDDDEWISFADARETLHDVARRMRAHQLCAAEVLWHDFGSDGHICQPDEALVAAFTRRAPRYDEERSPSMVRQQMRYSQCVRHDSKPPAAGQSPAATRAVTA